MGYNNFQYITHEVEELFLSLGISQQAIHAMRQKRKHNINKPTKNIKKIRAALIALDFDVDKFSYSYGESHNGEQ